MKRLKRNLDQFYVKSTYKNIIPNVLPQFTMYDTVD